MTKSECVLICFVGVVLTPELEAGADAAGFKSASDLVTCLVPDSLLRRLRFEAIDGAGGKSTCFPTELNLMGTFPGAREDMDLTLDDLTDFTASVTGLTRLH